MKRLTVTLHADDVRRVASLRKQGIAIAPIVRSAIRAEYERRRPKRRRDPRRPSDIIAEIHARYPTPPDEKPRNYNVHDAKQARAAIIAMLKRSRN